MCSQVLNVWFEELGLVTGVVLLGVVYMGIDFRGGNVDSGKVHLRNLDG